MEGSQLVVHCGGWKAKVEDLVVIPVPERTPTYTPISHENLLGHIYRALVANKLTMIREQYALAREGKQMFGVIDVRNGNGKPDWGIAIGLRNSYDKSIAVGAVAGQRVFICDNLAFYGEVQLRQKHVGSINLDLPVLVNQLIEDVIGWKEAITVQTDRMKAFPLTDKDAHDLVIRAMRAGVMAAQRVPGIIEGWHKPEHEDFAARNAWSLYNSFTATRRWLREPTVRAHHEGPDEAHLEPPLDLRQDHAEQPALVHPEARVDPRR